MKTTTKRMICRILGALAFLLMLGIVRGMDLGLMPVLRGGVLAAACEAVGAAAWWKGGVIRGR